MRENVTSSTLRKNEYAHIWQRPLPAQPHGEAWPASSTGASHPDSNGDTINPYDGCNGYALYDSDMGTGMVPKPPTIPPPPPVENIETRYYQLEPETLGME